MEESSVKSLPFVRASKTVCRSGVSELEGTEKMASQLESSASCEDKGLQSGGGLKLDRNCITVTVRRGSIPDRKRKTSQWNIDLSNVKPSSLAELPPPSKLRKKFNVKSKLERSLTKRMRRETSDMITEHVTNLKRKQLAMFKKVENRSLHQVVPPSPSVISVSNETYIEEPPPTVYDSTSLYPRDYNIHQSLKYHTLEGSTGEKPIEPLIGATEDGMKFPENTQIFLPEQPTDRLAFSLPLPSPPQIISATSSFSLSRAESPLPFNPLTFGIQKLYPREE